MEGWGGGEAQGVADSKKIVQNIPNFSHYGAQEGYTTKDTSLYS
jgi:hypothetical protein